MNWLARRRLTAGLRRLGHRPQWGRDAGGGRYAACRDCVWAWGGTTLSTGNVAGTLLATDTCTGRR